MVLKSLLFKSVLVFKKFYYYTAPHKQRVGRGGREASDNDPLGQLITLGMQTRLINCPDLLKIEEFHWAFHWDFQFSNWDKLVTLTLTKVHAEHQYV